MDSEGIIDMTRRWIAEIVIGLNLCPFARRIFEAGTIRYVVSSATNEKSLLADLRRELEALMSVSISEAETTILIHPHVLHDFLDYNDFLDAAEGLLAELKLEGVIQIASFHPRYQFAETKLDAVENFTNRSPYPMLHLLREESINAITMEDDELLAIPERNIETLRALGREAIRAKLRALGLD